MWNQSAVENYLTFPVRPAVVPSPRSLWSRDQSLRSDTWSLLGTSGKVFDSPRALIGSSPSLHQGMLHSLNQSAAGENPVRESTGKPVARSLERSRETIPTLRFVRRPSTMDSFVFQQKEHIHRITWLISKDFTSWSFSLTNSPLLHHFLCWKVRCKNPGEFLFQFSFGGYVMYQRSGDGRFSGRWKIIALHSGKYPFPEF